MDPVYTWCLCIEQGQATSCHVFKVTNHTNQQTCKKKTKNNNILTFTVSTAGEAALSGCWGFGALIARPAWLALETTASVMLLLQRRTESILLSQ